MSSGERFSLTMDIPCEYVERGTAEDGEAIIRLRPQIEAYVKDNLEIDFDFTKLYWNRHETDDEDEPQFFDFEILFFKGVSDEPGDTDKPIHPQEPVG